ncbi:MAG TPA: hypothetical protein VG839_10010 [Asticcacaulis sp.]|nr:hypothetical protein [Asticcacaulis sp.]
MGKKTEESAKFRRSVFAGKFSHVNRLLSGDCDLAEKVKGIYRVAPYVLHDEAIAFFDALVADPQAFAQFAAERLDPCDACRLGASPFVEGEAFDIQATIDAASSTEKFFRTSESYDRKFRGTRGEGYNDKDLRAGIFARAWVFAARLRAYFTDSLKTRNQFKWAFDTTGLVWFGAMIGALGFERVCPMTAILPIAAVGGVTSAFGIGLLIQYLVGELLFKGAELRHQDLTKEVVNLKEQEGLRVAADYAARQQLLLGLMEQMIERAAHAYARSAEQGSAGREEMARWLRLAGYVRERIAANASYLEDQEWNIVIAYGALRDKAKHDRQSITTVHPYSIEKANVRAGATLFCSLSILGVAAAIFYHLFQGRLDPACMLPTGAYLALTTLGSLLSLLWSGGNARRLDALFGKTITDGFVVDTCQKAMKGLWPGDYRVRYDQLVARLAELLRRGW